MSTDWTEVGSAALVGLLGLQGAVFLLLALLLVLDRVPPERAVGRAISWLYGAVAALAALATLSLFLSGAPRLEIEVGRWILLSGYDFHFVLQLDRLSAPFLLLATALCAVVAVFSERYLHRESGFYRYFLLLCLFGLGDDLTVVAGSIEVLYCSWELLGLTSTLLIGFFHERRGPVQNGFYTFVVYRLSDLSLLLASVLVSHLLLTGDFSTFLGQGSFPDGRAPIGEGEASLLGFLFLIAAIGKAAQLPLSGWLPRAMEGPTPSTAIFYGALSVHAGVYLMLRFSPLQTPPVAAATLVVGLSTALMANFVGQVQTEAKTRLAYASLAQVALMFVEVGLGLRWLPVVHAIGHALLRSVQFLRAPSLLHEIHELHSALGGARSRERAVAGPLRRWGYRAALDGLFLDSLIERGIIRPFQSLCKSLTSLDEAVLTLIGGPSR